MLMKRFLANIISAGWLIGFLLVISAVLQASEGTDFGYQDEPKIDVKKIPYKIIHETYRLTEGRYNWELVISKADGSDAVNITNTPDVDEMYAHASPDGTKICFVADEMTRRGKVRNVYYMNIDGSNRVKIASNARQPCWGPDSKSIAYLKGEYDRYTTRPYATSEVIIYDLQTGKYKRHPNSKLEHLYALCWSPDGKWFFAATQGAEEISDTIIAFEADGTRIFDLENWGVRGCRPDVSRDGKKLVWGETDWLLRVGELSFEDGVPKVLNIKSIVSCPMDMKLYHIDLSPDGKYVTFSYGPFEGAQQVAGRAQGWNIRVSDLDGNWVQITDDGQDNKEPDWIPAFSETAGTDK